MMGIYEKSYALEKKLIAEEASDFEFRIAYAKLCEELQEEIAELKKQKSDG